MNWLAQYLAKPPEGEAKIEDEPLPEPDKYRGDDEGDDEVEFGTYGKGALNDGIS